MKKLAFLSALSLMTCVYGDPGIMIDIDIIFEHPSGSGEGTMA